MTINRCDLPDLTPRMNYFLHEPGATTFGELSFDVFDIKYYLKPSVS